MSELRKETDVAERALQLAADIRLLELDPGRIRTGAGDPGGGLFL
jgi:hypothetical protein